MPANFNPILPCEENEVVSISLTTLQESSLDNDFIPIVRLDKTYKEDGFKYTDNKQTCSLSPYIQDQEYKSEMVMFDNKDEFILRFEIKQGNSVAKDNRGYLNAIGHGVNIISKTEFTIKYDQKILLKISKKDIKSGAYIDFYANDNDWKYYTVSNVHCGRVRIETKDGNHNIIFPLKDKPLNDANSTVYNNHIWNKAAGDNSATYNSNRGNGRKHAGRDLYGNALETDIVAICDGEVLSNGYFYSGTNAIVILHTTMDGRKFIARYGEVDPASVKLGKGESVKQGDKIATIGNLNPRVEIAKKTTNMLHFELYSGSVGYDVETHPLTDRKSANKFQRRSDIQDPLDILIEGYNNTFKK